jgi:hypothetical protein
MSNAANQIQVTTQAQGNHVVYICNTTRQPYVNLAQLQIIFPNVSSGTLRNRLGLVQLSVVKNAEIRTSNGVKLVQLFPASVVSDLAFEFDLALAKLMGSAGATVYLYGLAGYQVKPTVPEQPKLKPYEENVKVAHSIRDITDTLFDNPRLAQFLIDQTIDQCFSKALPSTEVPIKGAAEIAEALGLPINDKNRLALGRFMAKQGHEILKEERLCNGQLRTINCYRVTPEIERSVQLFFS